MHSHVVTREVAIEGRGRHDIDHQVRKRKVEPLYRGVYLVGETDDADEAWLARLGAHLHRGGPTAAISHRAAARLHGLEAVGGTPEDLLVPFDSTFRRRPAIRTRSLGEHDVTLVRGLRTTILERTLPDLRRFLSADDFEVAFESALRGPDPRRPDVWDEDLLQRLLAGIEELPNRRPGVREYRRFVLQRGSLRPTGSFAETRAWQAFRAANVSGLVRQPMVRVVNQRGTTQHTWFPDFGDLARGVLIEIDGHSAHGTPDALDRDLQRQNQLSEWFVMLRWAATRVMGDPGGVGAEAHRRLATAPVRAGGWSVPGGRVIPAADGWTVQLTR